MKHKLKLVLDQSSVNTAMMKMAKEIDMKSYPLAIIAILKGGVYAAYELLKLLNLIEVELLGKLLVQRKPADVVIGHIGLESYGDEMKSQGEVKLMTPLDLSRNDIRGRAVIIVDDCVETGRTLTEAEKIIAGYEPRQLYTAVLVDKVALRMMRKKPDIIGWSYTGTGFLVGCGMGMGERYRGLSEICEVVDDENTE